MKIFKFIFLQCFLQNENFNYLYKRDILKFWKKKKEVDEVAIENNENLTKRFSECFKNKTSFNTLGTEALTDIRLMVIYLKFVEIYLIVSEIQIHT